MGLWEVAGRNISPILLAPATATVQAFVEFFLDGTLFGAFAGSLQALVIGYSLATVIGITVGLLMGRYRTIENLLDTYVTTALAARMAAVIPLVIIFFGLSLSARIAVVVLFVEGFDIPELLATVVAIIVVSVVAGALLHAVDGRLNRWQPTS